MNRRLFLGSLTAAALAQPASPRVNGARLRSHLETLSVFGRPPGGTFADGVSRIAYSDADVAGRKYTMSLMEAAGLKPRIDAAGNISAIRAGTDPSLAAVLFGSHIDSVPSGGNFDGDLGSLAAIEVVQTLNEAGVRTRRPLEIVIWCNEEGFAYNNGLNGSRAAAGLLEPGELEVVWNGVKKADALRKVGGNPDRIEEARRKPGSSHCYLELHIEQGGNLDEAGVPVGVVEGIVAIDRYEVEIRGFANHAGTTPMPKRHDALVAASYLTVAVNEIVWNEPGRQVGTVGQLTVSPNSPNVVPGLVKLTVELRDLSAVKIVVLADRIRARAQEIGAQTQTEIGMRRVSHHAEALATPDVQASIEATAKKLKVRSTRLPSGAGHDAQAMSTLFPMGMIFIPSIGGISHSPKELSSWEHCTLGADVLLNTVLTWAS